MVGGACLIGETMVGKYGSIIFETNDKHILAINNLSVSVGGRWSGHAVIGRKERKEFLGPDAKKVSFQMTLSAEYGIRPRTMLEKLEHMVESGYVDYLMIGGRPIGYNRFAITSISEAWDVLYSEGELSRATVSITMEEYV